MILRTAEQDRAQGGKPRASGDDPAYDCTATEPVE